jgi:hypothetical protein
MADDHVAQPRRDRPDSRSVDELPLWVGRLVDWLDRPVVRWVRVPLGLLLIAVGVLGFLPVVGFWMIPLGALMLAQDVPFLRRPVHKFLAWMHHLWRGRGRRRGERR